MKVVNIAKYGSVAAAEKQGVVYCGGDSILNSGYADTQEGLDQYRQWLYTELEDGNERIIEAIEALSPKSLLGCWCGTQFCHCYVIADAYKAWMADIIATENNRELIEEALCLSTSHV